MTAILVLAAWFVLAAFGLCLCAASKPSLAQREAIRRAHQEWTK